MRFVVKVGFLTTGVIGIFLLLVGCQTIATPFWFTSTTGNGQSLKVLISGRQSLIHTDYENESSELMRQVIYAKPNSLYRLMAADGANAGNKAWEEQQRNKWYIEAQRYGEEAVMGGLVQNDPQAVNAGFKMFDWGFAHQAADGSFPGTGDPFHSTSFFVAAVARTLLIIQQSPESARYRFQVAKYTPLVHRAARWMILPEVWERGTRNNQPYTHRRYLVGAALGLTGKLTGDRQLIDYAQKSIASGLSLQQPDGVNPEKGGYDSSYQMASVLYAQRWLAYFADDELAPRVKAMIDRALLWEETRIWPTGMISSEGNARTAGQEIRRTGEVKEVDHRLVFRGFAYWAAATGEKKWATIASRIVKYYCQNKF